MTHYLALDLETTGLDPERDEVLEVAWTVLDDRLDQLVPIESMVLGISNYGEFRITASPIVVDMHTENGLLAVARRSVNSPSDASEAIMGTLRRLQLDEPTRPPLTLLGSSVHTDLAFVRVHMPSVARHLSYRIFDVTTVTAFMGAAGADPTDYTTKGMHRAADDIAWSIAAAQGCLAVVRERVRG